MPHDNSRHTSARQPCSPRRDSADKTRFLILRRCRSPIHFRRAGLIKAHIVACSSVVPDSLEQPESASGNGVSRVFRLIEANANVGLRGEIVDFIRLSAIKRTAQSGAVGYITIMQAEPHASIIRIGADCIEALNIKRRSTADDAMNFVARANRNSARNEPSWPVVP